MEVSEDGSLISVHYIENVNSNEPSQTEKKKRKVVEEYVDRLKKNDEKSLHIELTNFSFACNLPF